MGIKLAKKNNQYNMQRRTFYIDSADDLDSIEAEYDCGIGDLAELPDGTVYCRHSDGYDGDLWEKRGSAKSEGGGGGSSGGNVLVVNADDATMTLDKTWSEITTADFAVLKMPVSETTQIAPIGGFYSDESLDVYQIYFVSHEPDGNVTITFETNTENGYPVYNDGNDDDGNGDDVNAV